MAVAGLLDLRQFVVGICKMCNPRMECPMVQQTFLFEATDVNGNNELDVDEVAEAE